MPCWRAVEASLGSTYLEVVVFVQGSSSELRNKPQRGHIWVLTGKEEDCHTAACGHAVLGQGLIHIWLRLEKCLKGEEQQGKEDDLSVECLQIFFSNNDSLLFSSEVNWAEEMGVWSYLSGFPVSRIQTLQLVPALKKNLSWECQQLWGGWSGHNRAQSR